MSQRPSPERVALRLLAEVAPAPDTPDGMLLARYVRENDPAAFRALYDRYAGLVYRVCRRGLGAGDVDAAFQATWLVFARKADTVRRPEALAGWLTRVGLRVTARARRRATRHPTPRSDLVDAAADAAPGTDPVRQAELRDLADVVTRAVAGLPDRERAVFELCHLEGLGRSETITKLGLTPLQFDRSMRKARDLLQRRLGKSGVTLPAGLTGLAVGGQTPVSVPAALAETAANAFAGRLVPLAQVGLPASAMSLARSVLSDGRMWTLALAAVAAVSFAAGAVVVAESHAPLPQPPLQAQVEREPLWVKNERIMRDQLAPRIRDVLQELAPADNPVRLVAVRSWGSEVEAEFRYDKKLAYEPGEGGYRFRYCVLRRIASGATDLGHNGKWHPLHSSGDRLSWFMLELPSIRLGSASFPLGSVEIRVGVEQLARIKAILHEMPTDDRAEQAHHEQAFAPPGSGLVLPAWVKSVAGNETSLFCVAGPRLYVWSEPLGWRYLGRDLTAGGNFLAANQHRLYRVGGSVAGGIGIYSRPIDPPEAEWELLCTYPVIGPEWDELHGMGVGDNRIVIVAKNGRMSFLDLTRPKAGWRHWLKSAPIHHAVSSRGELYAKVNPNLYYKYASLEPGGKWEQQGPDVLFHEDSYLASYRDQILSYNVRPGNSVYSRSRDASPDVAWRVIGRVD